MLCSLGVGRMAVMARLLEAGSFLPKAADEISRQKLAALNIYRDLREADEANLLDEEDMNVFGLKPMADPLHLVCCKACKKPVKASQYAAHAELCRSLNATGESILDVNGATGHRKPPRKERKKLRTSYANQATPVAELEGSESIDIDDMSSLSMDVKRLQQSAVEYHSGSICSSVSILAGNSGSVDTASVMVGSGLSPENTDRSACVIPPPTKRSKLIAGEHLPLSDDPLSAYGVTKISSIQDAHTYKDFPGQTIPRCEIPNDFGVHCKYCGQVHGQCLHVQDIPRPLATKIYYSQRNNLLKSALTYLYREALTEEPCNDLVVSEVPKQIMMPSQVLSQGVPSHEQVGDMLNKKESIAQTPDQILVQNSEVYLGKLGGCLPATNFSNQFQVDNVRRSQTASVGLARSKYLSKAYSFADNSGKLLGNMQQPTGSVPVV